MLRSWSATISKIFALSLSLVIGAGLFSGCGDSEDKTGTVLQEDAAKQAAKASMQDKIKAAYAKGAPNKVEKKAAAGK